MDTTRQDMLHWEISEPDGWQKEQYRAWKRDAKLRASFLDFYTFLQDRRRDKVEEKKKRTAQQTIKEATPMNTTKATPEQIEAMNEIVRWKTNSPLGEGAAPPCRTRESRYRHGVLRWSQVGTLGSF